LGTVRCARVLSEQGEASISKPTKQSLLKRSREQNHRVRQQEKEARRAQRAADKKTRPVPQGEQNPDSTGISTGDQPPLLADK